MAQQLVLNVEGIQNSSNELRNLSTEVSELCKTMYDEIKGLGETEAFKTITSSELYFEKINELNGVVPKYTDDVLKFSEFLSNYVITNYEETDQEVQSEIANNLEESLEQLNNVKELGNGANLDQTSSGIQTASNENTSAPTDMNANPITEASTIQLDANRKVYRFEKSNVIADEARKMGFTEEQVDIAVGISRGETDNYKSPLAQSHNYGGLRSGDGWAHYNTESEGIHAYLSNLKTNYFDQGLNTVEKIQPKYCPASDGNDPAGWINLVRGCMK